MSTRVDDELFNLQLQALINFAEKAKTGNDIHLLRKWMEVLIISIDKEYGTPKDSRIFHPFTDVSGKPLDHEPMYCYRCHK